MLSMLVVEAFLSSIKLSFESSSPPPQTKLLFGFKVNNPYEILIKISNATEYIEWDIQNIEAPRTHVPII